LTQVRSLPPPRRARTAAPAAGPARWQVWTGLWTIYLVWGSTYLAIRVMVETIPALLGAGVRFMLAGAILLGLSAARRRPVSARRAELGGALLVGTLLCGANAVVTLAEQEVPSGLAALLVASIPLWVILLRRLAGERPAPTSVAAVAIGFVGVAILLAPGEQTGGASLIAMLAVVGAALMWACGSVAAPRSVLPRDPIGATGWQMLLGGVVCGLAGLAVGEASEVDPSRFSTDSVLAFAYLVLVGSCLAFTAYAWLLQHAPLSKVATYAYVNPVVAIVLGALILDEVVAGLTIAGAAVIVLSVALVVRAENRPAARRDG
jgi:drug/metabolite transporter (DMT)-like permease